MTDLLLEEGRMTSFKDYAKGKTMTKIAPSTAAWFDDRPELAAQVFEARDDGWTWTQIFGWLKDEHEFPLKNATSVRKWMLER